MTQQVKVTMDMGPNGNARTSVAHTSHCYAYITRPTHTNPKHAHKHAGTLRSPSPHVKEGTASTGSTVQRSRSGRGHSMAMMMPPVAVAVALSLLAAWSLQPRAAAQSQAQAPGAAPAPSQGALDCTGALLNLSSCLTYVEAGSSFTRPEKGCCGALEEVVDGEAACLCRLVGGYGSFGVRVDAVRALALPTICRVEAPPPRLCAALGMPVTEPPGGAGTTESGYGTAATTPATSTANGGSATHRNRRRHLRLVLLPYCVALFTLLP